MWIQLFLPIFAFFLPEAMFAAPNAAELAPVTVAQPMTVTQAKKAPKKPAKARPALVEPVRIAPAVPAAIEVAVAPSANDIVGKVQDFYNGTKSFKATFQQTVTNQTFNKLKPKKSSGKVYILKPGKMRWDYQNTTAKTQADPKVSKSFISDGKHLWAVMHLNKEFYKSNLDDSALPVAVSFLMGTGDLLKEFDAQLDVPGKYGSKADLLLLLTPKTPSARYKKLWLVVDKDNFSVKQSVVLNTKGDINAIRFGSVAIDDPSLQPGHFIFNEKANPQFRLVQAPEN